MIDVVENDAFNSSPTDPKLMGPDVLQKAMAGESLASTLARTPLVWCSASAAKHSGCSNHHHHVVVPSGGAATRCN